MKNLERIISYLGNEMTGNEILLLENDLKTDLTLQQTLEFVKEVDSTLADKEYISFAEKLQDVRIKFKYNKDNSKIEDNKITSKHKFSLGWNLMTIAASLILIIFTVAVIKFTLKPTPESIFAQYYNRYEANIETRSEPTVGTSSLIIAIQLYDKGSYIAAIQSFLNIIKSDSNNTAARFFLGVSYMETKNISKAIENLNFVINQNDTAFVEHAEWYLALCYIKNGQKNDAISMLNKISTSQNFYKKMAVDVLKKLK